MRKLITFTFTLTLCLTAYTVCAYGQQTTDNIKYPQRASKLSSKASKLSSRTSKLQIEEKITGDLVNLDCYVGRDLKGPELIACSQLSPRDQSRLALLSNGRLFVLVSDDTTLRLGEKLSDFVGKRMWLIGIRKTLDGGSAALVVRGIRGELAR